MEPTSGTRILVIEDDSAIRATLVDILELNGYTVQHAATGTDGLARARAGKPDVVLTDISMPGLDGFGLIEALRADEQTRAIPVIIISASVDPERVRRGMDLGAEDFLVKPFTEDQVLRSIRARLEKKALLDELDAFAHTVAHDLKNPIAVLMTRVDLIDVMWPKASDEWKRKQIAELKGNTARLNNIVEELLVLAGVRRQQVPRVCVDMNAVIQEALGRVENLVQKSAVKIEQPREWPAALGHAPWIAEVWTNYLSNAIKYGGQPPHIQLGADRVPERDCVRFWVRDNGAGLTPDQQAQLFRLFSRIGNTRAKGHGLGLSIVRRITEKLGGGVGVESEPGKGSLFWFELPACPDSKGQG